MTIDDVCCPLCGITREEAAATGHYDPANLSRCYLGGFPLAEAGEHERFRATHYVGACGPGCRWCVEDATFLLYAAERDARIAKQMARHGPAVVTEIPEWLELGL